MNDYQLGESITLDHLLSHQDFAAYAAANGQSQNLSQGSNGANPSAVLVSQPQSHLLSSNSSTNAQIASGTSNSDSQTLFTSEFQAPVPPTQPLNSVYAAAYPATYGAQQYHTTAPTARIGESYPPTPSPETNINSSLQYHYSRSVSTNSRSPTPSRSTPLLQEFILPIQVRAAPFCDANDILEMDYEAYDLETFEDYSAEPAANFHPAPYTGSHHSLVNSISRDIKKAEEIAITRMKYHSFGYIDLSEGMFGKLNLRRPGAWSRCPSGVGRKVRRR